MMALDPACAAGSSGCGDYLDDVRCGVGTQTGTVVLATAVKGLLVL